jgi:hypothetical protein
MARLFKPGLAYLRVKVQLRLDITSRIVLGMKQNFAEMSIGYHMTIVLNFKDIEQVYICLWQKQITG